MKHSFSLALFLLLGATLIGCAPKQPQRIQAGGVQALTTMGIDLQDFKNAAGQLTQAILDNANIKQFATKNGRPPAITVGAIINKTNITIDLGQIAGRINEDLLNSGLVELIANDQGAIAASQQDASIVKADYFLEGAIMDIKADFDDLTERSYTFQLRLNDRQRRTIFHKTVDIAKQGEKSSAIGW